MRKIFSFAAMCAAILTAASCAHEEFDDYQKEGETVVLTATIGDADPDTKAELGTSGNGKPQTMWTDGDRITVFNGSRSYEFETSLEEAAPRADFTYVGNDFSADNGMIAVYPAGNCTADLAAMTVNVNIPSVQTATAGTFDPAAGAMVAFSRTESMAFKNTTALVKFTLATEGVKSVVLTGLGEEAVCGDMTVIMNEDGTVASVAPKTDGVVGTSVELSAAGDSKLAVGTTYYMAVVPGSFPKGFTVHVKYSADGEMHMVKGYTKSYDLERNFILNLGEFTVRELPVITSLSFDPAKNEGKILSKELYYDESGANGLYTKTRTASSPVMTVEDGKITGRILYLNNRNLVPTIEYTEGAKISYSVNGGDFTDWDGTTTIDFSKGTVLRVAKDGIFNEYVCNITNSGLPVVVLNQPDGDVAWPQLDINVWHKDTKWKTIKGENSTMAVYKADGTVDLETQTAMARLRGNTSQEYPKKPFAVKLDAEGGASILGMPAHDRWVLLANWKDKSLMCNHVALGVANKFVETFKTNANPGLLWNSRGKFVEVVYNGVHIGNYYLCEQIKIATGRLDINSPYDEESVITEDDIKNLGILIECDDNYDESENGQFISKHFIPVMLKDAGDANGVILNHVKTKIGNIEDNLYNGKYSTAYDYLDKFSFADMLLVYELAMNSEMGHPKSAYMYINGGGKVCAGPVWDFDWTSFPNNTNIKNNFDSSWDRLYTQSLMATASHKNLHYRFKAGWFSSAEYPSDPKKNDVPYLWYPMLVKDSDFKSVLAERWSIMSPILSDYAKKLIIDTAEEIAVSWEYNNSIWPTYHSKNGRSEATGSIAFRGDENMTSWYDVYMNLYNVYMDRLDGMNSFVGSKTWPSWSISTASK